MPTPLPDLPGIYYARIEGTFEGLPSGFTMAFKAGTAPPPGLADEALANAVAQAIALEWPMFANPVLPVSYAGSQVLVYPLHSPASPPSVQPLTAPGLNVGPLAPVFTAALISEKVHRRGRGSQSRTFMSPVLAADTTADGKNLTNVQIGIMQTHWDNFRVNTLTQAALIGGTSFTYVQLSKKAPGATYNILSSIVQPALSTQRRRQRRG